MEGDDRWQIWTSTTVGTLPTQMTLGSAPSFSPDGKRILYLKPDEKTGKSVIWYMDADGANQTQLTQGESNEEAPSWSADGQYLLFASDAGLDESGRNNMDIYIMKSDGTGKTQLTTNGSVDTLPVMDPEGKYVYFVSNRGGAWNVWRMELAMDAK
jgi:Tol biopolymer transport system component